MMYGYAYLVHMTMHWTDLSVAAFHDVRSQTRQLKTHAHKVKAKEKGLTPGRMETKIGVIP